MKRPLDFVFEIARDSTDKAVENEKSNTENLERLLNWITGFSLIAFGFIVSQISEIEKRFGHDKLKFILILLLVSICLGVVHRFAFYYWRVAIQKLNYNFKMMLGHTEEVMEIDAEDVSTINDYKEVIRLLRENFGDDLSSMIAIYESSDDNYKQFLLDDLKRYYKSAKEWTKKDYENALLLLKKSL